MFLFDERHPQDRHAEGLKSHCDVGCPAQIRWFPGALPWRWCWERMIAETGDLTFIAHYSLSQRAGSSPIISINTKVLVPLLGHLVDLNTLLISKYNRIITFILYFMWRLMSRIFVSTRQWMVKGSISIVPIWQAISRKGIFIQCWI